MRNKLKDGGPAFPSGDGPNSETGHQCGMSLRDYFAGQALTAIIAHSELVDDDGNFTAEPGKGFPAINNFAQFAYVTADAMLAARNGGAK